MSESFSLILKELMTKYGISNYRLATDLGVSKGTIANYLSGTTEPQAAIRSLILDYFKKREVGEIGSTQDSSGKRKEYSSESVILKVEEPHIVSGYYYPDVNAAAGLEKGIENSELTKIPIYLPSFGHGVYFVNVFGDSMYPKFCSGEIVGIAPCEKEFVNFGHPYVVVFTNGDTYIKYIRRGKDDNHWVLANENPKYQEREFHLDKIRSIYTIKGVITKLTM